MDVGKAFNGRQSRMLYVISFFFSSTCILTLQVVRVQHIIVFG
jgi:hypothetical protein